MSEDASVNSSEDSQETVGASETNILSGNQEEKGSITFLDAIDAQYRDDPSISKFSNVNDLVKEHVNLQSLLGRKGVVIPKEGDPSEVWSKYRSEMGVPEEASGYFEDASNVDELTSRLAEIAHKNNLSASQFNELVNGYSNYYNSKAEQVEKEAEALTAENLEALKREWGRAYEAKANIGSSALNTITNGSPDAIANIVLSDGTLLGNNPFFVKAMASVGEVLQEKGLLQGESVHTSAMSPEEANARLAQLMSDPERSAILFSQDFHPMKEELVKERQRLLKFAFPEN